jgi:transposase
MSGKRYTEEFKIAAVKQVAERGHPASEVAARLGVSIHSLYTWTKRYGMPEEARKAVDSQADEMRRLKAELKRVTEERDILKNRPTRLPGALVNRNSAKYTWCTQRL